MIHIGKNDIDRFAVAPNTLSPTRSSSNASRPMIKIVLNKQQPRTLPALREPLLPRLLSGDLSLKEACIA